MRKGEGGREGRTDLDGWEGVDAALSSAAGGDGERVFVTAAEPRRDMMARGEGTTGNRRGNWR